MKTERIPVTWLYAMNALVVLSFALSILLIETQLKIWFILAVQLTVSVIETIVYYRMSNNSFDPLPSDKVITCFLLSTGLAVFLIGAILIGKFAFF